MQTLSEYRVGTTFNPSKSGTVDEIKQKAVELIDLIADISTDRVSLESCAEVSRLKELAMTDVESAAMWAVKAATKPEKE